MNIIINKGHVNNLIFNKLVFSAVIKSNKTY